MNVDSEISSAAIFESDREEGEKEPVVEELLRKMKALCNTDISQSERPVEDNEDNESENETDDNDKNMHEKQDAAETDSTIEGRHDESVSETRSSVRQGNQSNSQDGNQNGCGKCGKRVVKGDICDLCKKSFHFKCAGTAKEKVQDAGVLICKVCKENCSKCSDYSEYKTRTKKEIKNLKSNISQLEKHVEHLNNELSSIHKQYDEKEKEYRRERKLRIKYQDLYNASSSSGSESSSTSSSGSESEDEKHCGKNRKTQQRSRRAKNYKDRKYERRSGYRKEKRKLKESECEEDEGFRRRSVHVQSHRQSRQKEKSSDIEGEISENYRLAEEYLNMYVGASETSKKELSKSNGEHDKNRTEQSTEYRNDTFSRPRYSANGKLRSQRRREGGLIDEKNTYDKRDCRIREDNLVPAEEVLRNLDKLNETNQQHYRASNVKPNRTLHKPGPVKRKVCFNFRNTGKCKYGSSCKFSHNISQYRNNDVNSTSKSFDASPFLEEIKSLVDTVKSMVENQFRMIAPFVNQAFPQCMPVVNHNQSNMHPQAMSAMPQGPPHQWYVAGS